MSVGSRSLLKGNHMVLKRDKLPAGMKPRGLNVVQAAAYWGCGQSTFKKLVKLGIAPRPLDNGGLWRNIYDIRALDAAMDSRAVKV
jgi:hypothetical protein